MKKYGVRWKASGSGVEGQGQPILSQAEAVDICRYLNKKYHGLVRHRVYTIGGNHGIV